MEQVGYEPAVQPSIFLGEAGHGVQRCARDFREQVLRIGLRRRGDERLALPLPIHRHGRLAAGPPVTAPALLIGGSEKGRLGEELPRRHLGPVEQAQFARSNEHPH